MCINLCIRIISRIGKFFLAICYLIAITIGITIQAMVAFVQTFVEELRRKR